MVALVLGAKSNPKIPNIEFSTVLYVNGSIFWSRHIANRGQSIHYMTTYVLADYPEREHYAARRNALRGTKSDICILVHTAPKARLTMSFEELQYSTGQTFNVTLRDRWAWTKRIVSQETLQVMLKYVRNADPSIPAGIDVSDVAEPRCLRPSSGVSSLIYVLSHLSNEKEIVVAGIGLETKNDHFYLQGTQEERKHLYVDGLYFAMLQSLYGDRIKIQTTESSLSELSGLSLWDGPTIDPETINLLSARL